MKIQAVDEPTLAKVLGISTRQVRNLRSNGVLKQSAKSRYDLGRCVRAYIEYVAHGKTNAAGTGARTRLWQAQARKAELANAEREGRLLPVEDVQLGLNEFAQTVRAGVLALPSRVASELAGMTDAALIREALMREARSLLHTAADKLEKWAKEPAAGGKAKRR